MRSREAGDHGRPLGATEFVDSATGGVAARLVASALCDEVSSLPEISVVIPVLNAAKTVADQLEAVLGQKGVASFEVVVVDNGSSDGTLELVTNYAKKDERVQLIDGSAAPRGGGAAKNLGAKRARSDLIAFCDADDLVAPGWLQAVQVGLLSAPVVLVVREYWSLNPHLSRRFQRKTRLLDKAFGVVSISGGAFGIRKGAYQEIGGFDETFAGSVDTEFSLRLHRAGYAVIAVPEAEVSVRLPRSPRQMFTRRRLLARSWREIASRHGVRSPDSSLRGLAKTAVALVVHSHRLIRSDTRMAWAQTAGTFVGRLEARRSPRRDRKGGT